MLSRSPCLLDGALETQSSLIIFGDWCLVSGEWGAWKHQPPLPSSKEALCCLVSGPCFTYPRNEQTLSALVKTFFSFLAVWCSLPCLLCSRSVCTLNKVQNTFAWVTISHLQSSLCPLFGYQTLEGLFHVSGHCSSQIIWFNVYFRSRTL